MRSLITSVRPQFWVFSIVPGLLGLWLTMKSFPLPQTLMVVTVLACGAALAELINDFADRHSDRRQRVKRVGPVAISGGSGVVQLGGLSHGQVAASGAALVCIILGSAVLLGQYVTVLAVVGLVLALGYSLEPLKLKHKGVWGLLAMAVGRGFVSLHIGWTASSDPSAVSVAVGAFLTLLCFSTALLSYLADFPEDSQLGIPTFPVQVGFNQAALSGAVAGLASLAVLGWARLHLAMPLNVLVFPFGIMVIALAWLTARAHADDIPSVSRLQLLGMITFVMGPLVTL